MICRKLSKDSSNQLWATDDVIHYPACIIHRRYGTWNPWMGGNCHELLRRSSYPSMTRSSGPASQTHVMWRHNYRTITGLLYVACATHESYNKIKSTGIITTHITSSPGFNYGVVSDAVVLTIVHWWVFCSHVRRKFKNTELTFWTCISYPLPWIECGCDLS